jgi:RNA polymerase sigma-70 factor (ECF subfamily)
MPPIAPEELSRLYRQHAGALRLFIRQFEADEDIVQDVFVKLAQQSEAPERILPWLYRVARNAALASARSNSRRRKREAKVHSPELWFAATDDRLDGVEATRLLAELSLEQREVIVARIWGGLTFEEVAQIAGCSLPAAHRRYQAGLTALRERLERPWTSSTKTT